MNWGCIDSKNSQCDNTSVSSPQYRIYCNIYIKKDELRLGKNAAYEHRVFLYLLFTYIALFPLKICKYTMSVMDAQPFMLLQIWYAKLLKMLKKVQIIIWTVFGKEETLTLNNDLQMTQLRPRALFFMSTLTKSLSTSNVFLALPWAKRVSFFLSLVLCELT